MQIKLVDKNHKVVHQTESFNSKSDTIMYQGKTYRITDNPLVQDGKLYCVYMESDE